MSCTAVRSPKPILHRQPREDLTLERCPATPNATGRGGLNMSHTESLVRQCGSAFPRLIARPLKIVRCLNVPVNRGDGLVELIDLHVAQKGSIIDDRMMDNSSVAVSDTDSLQ